MSCASVETQVAAHLVDVGALEVIPREQIFAVRGKPFVNGALAVLKKREPFPGECRVIRFVINMIPVNSYRKLVTSGLGTLSPASTWTSIHLPAGNVLLWSGDDQRGAFHVYRLPRAWRPYMAIGKGSAHTGFNSAVAEV